MKALIAAIALAIPTVASAGTLNWQWSGISSENLPMAEYERNAGIVVFTDDRLPGGGKQTFPVDRARDLTILTTDGCRYTVNIEARSLVSDTCANHPFAGGAADPALVGKLALAEMRIEALEAKIAAAKEALE